MTRMSLLIATIRLSADKIAALDVPAGVGAYGSGLGFEQLQQLGSLRFAESSHGNYANYGFCLWISRVELKLNLFRGGAWWYRHGGTGMVVHAPASEGL